MYFTTIEKMGEKRNEVLIHATIWVNLENIILSEKGQTQQDKHMTPRI